MKSLTWYTSDTANIYDEPEDAPGNFPAFLAAHAEQAIGIAYWNIAKAKRLGVWREDLAAFLVFNWYPGNSTIPAAVRWAYVPFKVLQYRLWHSKRAIPCYLSLWTRAPGQDEYGNRYWSSKGQNAWAWFWFRLFLWPRPTGKAYF